MVLAKVTSPRNEGEGRSQYTTYCVETPKTFVRRRYSDFQWLYSRLMTERPGAIVPIIPHRRALTNKDKFSEELIQERTTQLHKFLKKVCDHPELVNAPSMTPFMTLDFGDDFDLGKTKMEKADPTKSLEENEKDFLPHDTDESNSKGGAIKKGVRNLVARGRVMMSVKRGNLDLEETPEDPDIALMKDYVYQLDDHVKRLHTQATALVGSTKAKSVAMKEFSSILSAWKLTHENRNCPDQPDTTFKMIDFAATGISEIGMGTLNAQTDMEQEKLEEAVQDLALVVQAWRAALSKRKDLQVTYTTRIKQVQDRTNDIVKAQKAGKSAIILKQAENDKEKAEKESDVARTSLDDGSHRLLREGKRIQPLIEQDLAKCMLDYAELQVKYSKLTCEAFEKLVPELKESHEKLAASADTATDAGKSEA